MEVLLRVVAEINLQGVYSTATGIVIRPWTVRSTQNVEAMSTRF